MTLAMTALAVLELDEITIVGASRSAQAALLLASRLGVRVTFAPALFLRTQRGFACDVDSMLA